MSDFEKASTAFRNFAAKALHLPPDQVHVGPLDEEMAKDFQIPAMFDAHVKLKVGNAWGFEASSSRDGLQRARGWALPDGTIITYAQNLGKLFQEARAWDAKPHLSAEELATLTVWSMGMNHAVVEQAGDRFLMPTLKIDSTGNGTLNFLMSYRQLGPGGAAGGPAYQYECNVKLSKGHEAHLTRSKNLNGDANANPPGLAPVGP